MTEKGKARQKKEAVYIATTKVYASNNRFKVGGVKSVHHIKSRLSSYNSGRPVDDRMYVCFVVECANSTHLEARIREMLGEYIDGDKNTEVYNMHYTDLLFMIDLISNHYNYENDIHELKLDHIIDHVMALEPYIPDELIINETELKECLKNGRRPAKFVKVDFDLMNEQEQIEWLKNILYEIKLRCGGDMLERKCLFAIFERQYDAKFNKVKMWKKAKCIADELEITLKY